MENESPHPDWRSQFQRLEGAYLRPSVHLTGPADITPPPRSVGIDPLGRAPPFRPGAKLRQTFGDTRALPRHGCAPVSSIRHHASARPAVASSTCIACGDSPLRRGAVLAAKPSGGQSKRPADRRLRQVRRQPHLRPLTSKPATDAERRTAIRNIRIPQLSDKKRYSAIIFTLCVLNMAMPKRKASTLPCSALILGSDAQMKILQFPCITVHP